MTPQDLSILNLAFNTRVDLMPEHIRAQWFRQLQRAFDLPEGGILDLHALTACLLYRCPYDEVTVARRRHGKQTNFALLYGAARPFLLLPGVSAV